VAEQGSKLKDRVAVVTGAGRGIGRAIALAVVAEGASVAVNSITDSAQKVAREITAAGGKAIFVQGDVSDSTDVTRLFDETVKTFGTVHILVNNAGITRDGLLMRMSEDDFDRVMAVNMKSVFLCSRAALKSMLRERWGRIINISSIIGLTGNAGQANYAASKSAMFGFAKSLAKEVASRNITVNVIAPGFIDTEMTQSLSGEQREAFIKRIPSGRLGTPEDVARSVLFLVSEEAPYITGQIVTVDGGLTLV